MEPEIMSPNTSSWLPGLEHRSNTGPEGDDDVSDRLLCEKYGQWSAWSRCNPKCEQTRVRACRKPEECGRAWVKEKRTCARRGGRDCRTLSYKVRQNKEKISKLLIRMPNIKILYVKAIGTHR